MLGRLEKSHHFSRGDFRDALRALAQRRVERDTRLQWDVWRPKQNLADQLSRQRAQLLGQLNESS